MGVFPVSPAPASTTILWRFRAKARLLRKGARSDLDDRATILEPDLYPEGMEYVMVNGVLTLDEGALTGALPGAVLDRREVRGR